MKSHTLLCGVSFLLAVHSLPAASLTQLISTAELTGGDGTINNFAINGTTAYAVVSGGGNHRVLQIDDLGSSNIVSPLVDNITWRSSAPGRQTGIAGRSFISGNSLIITDSTSDGAYRIDLTTTNSVTALSLSIGNPQQAAFDSLNSRLLAYDSTGDQLLSIPAAGGTPTVLLNDTALAAITGDDTPTGITVGADGTIFFWASLIGCWRKSLFL